jgi:hypothetical protein
MLSLVHDYLSVPNTGRRTARRFTAADRPAYRLRPAKGRGGCWPPRNFREGVSPLRGHRPEGRTATIKAVTPSFGTISETSQFDPRKPLTIARVYDKIRVDQGKEQAMKYVPPKFTNLSDMAAIDVGRLTEQEARTILESIRWPTGPVCPHCGGSAVTRLQAKSEKVRDGVIQCNGCRK